MPALSAVLLTCIFRLSLLFFNISLTRPHQSHPYLWFWAAPALQRAIGQYRTKDVADNLGTSLSLAQRTLYISGERLWGDFNGKMETRHPIEGPFGCEFPAFVIIAEL